MPNLKDIRRRIRSVKSTQKITQAMRMVAAAKVKRAENRVKAGRPYAEALREVFGQVYRIVKNQTDALSASRYQELLTPRPIKNVGIVVVSSDRGLCGSYNSTIIRQALRLEKELVARGLTPKFYLVGNKVIQAFKRYSQAQVLGRIANMTATPSIQDANTVAETLVEAFLSGEIDSIEVLSTHFVSMISYKSKMTALMPLKGLDESEEGENVQAKEEGGLQPEMLLEPDPVQTLNQMVPMYLSNQIYILLLEASASELAARMTAMSNATKNAAELIGKLTIQYNKARQASITQEILEVVSGAQAIQ
jgi:F-type H+-transporting ATPase subunit gamma